MVFNHDQTAVTVTVEEWNALVAQVTRAQELEVAYLNAFMLLTYPHMKEARRAALLEEFLHDGVRFMQDFHALIRSV